MALVWFVAALVAALASLTLPASALALHEYEESFGPDGTESTIFSGFLGSRPVAVDEGAGTIYVGNKGDQAIFKFNEEHHPADFSGLGSNEITGVSERNGSGRGQLAVDQASHRIYATGGAAGNSILAFEASGLAGEFSALGANEVTGFTTLCGVAVDANGDIYAGDLGAQRVTVFAPSGAEITHFPVGEAPGASDSGPCNLAVDSSGAVYVVHWHSSVEKFTPSAYPVTALTTYSSAGTVDPGPSYSIAVNLATNHLFVNRITKVIEYDAGGVEVAPPFPRSSEEPEATLAGSSGIAAKGAGLAERIYVSNLSASSSRRVAVFGPTKEPPVLITGPAGPVAKTSATLTGTLNPRDIEVTECAFQYVDAADYEPLAENPYEAGEVTPCDEVDGNPIMSPSEIPIDSADHEVGAQLSDLSPNTEYHYRLVAANAGAADAGEDKTLTTLGPPLISAESAGAITATRARIEAEIDPRGEATSFAVQYVSSAQFEAGEYAEAITVPVPFKPVGMGIGPVAVAQELIELAPGTVYHYRLLAENLTDPQVHGEDEVFATFPESNPALPDGRAYELVSPVQKQGEVFPPETKGSLGGSCSDCLPGSDVTKMPMQPAPGGGSIAYEGQAFGGGTASGANEYLARRGADGWLTDAISGPEYSTNLAFAEQGQGYLAFADDLSRAIINQVMPSLSSQAPTDYANLYLRESSSGQLTPLITEAPPNRLPKTRANSLLVVYAGANTGSALSPAFSHVVFEANDALTGEVPGVAPAAPGVAATERNLYEWVDGQLRLVNVLPANAGAAPNSVIGSGRLILVSPQNEGPVFSHAISNDGSRIYWTAKASGQLYLRIDATKTVKIPDAGDYLTASLDGTRTLLSNGHLYETAASTPTQIADLSAGAGGFEGILGASDDLRRIYFVDSAVLAGESAEHRTPTFGGANLYLWEAGTTSFIATLASSDNKLGKGLGIIGDWRPSPSSRTAQVSSDGRYAAFMSTVPLTGYDNSQQGGEYCGSGAGSSCSEVFEFDTQQAKLTCVSCNPSGQRPLGGSNLSLITFGGQDTFISEPANLTEEQGRIFFESQDTLSTRDTNGHIQDVYEWERPGTGSCAVGAAGYSPTSGGCLALISSGHSTSDSQFLNATPSGEDAFIVTRGRLLPKDKDDLLDLYDARVGGGFPESLEAVCAGEACKGPLVPQSVAQIPGSASYSGPGNPPVPCRAGYVRKHGKCVKKHKKHNVKKHKKHRHGRHRRAVKHERGTNG